MKQLLITASIITGLLLSSIHISVAALFPPTVSTVSDEGTSTDETTSSQVQGTASNNERSARKGNLRSAERVQKEKEEVSEKFSWWPTDAKPGAVLDEERGGYWWYPTTPGKVRPWGNRGYIYVYKIIFDYKEDELPPPQQDELRPSLLVRRMIKNLKVFFDYDKSELRSDAVPVLQEGMRALSKNPQASILISGNADQRGSEEYNYELAKRRAHTVQSFFVQQGLPAERIKIVSHGKLNAIAPVTDLAGMQKDRNAQFMVAEVEEVMLPYQGPPRGLPAKQIDEQTYIIQEEKEVTGTVKVSTREYVIKKGDTLSGIAAKEMGKATRWRFLYEFNKDRIGNPDSLQPGDVILIPVE